MADDPRWQLVLRIAESDSLGKSPKLADFLRYVCDRQIRGKGEEITEQQIGVKVFGRHEGYNSNDDNIVRNYARMLRKRLENYFRKEGSDEALILCIPRGGYIPVFSPRELAAATPELSLEAGFEAATTVETPNLRQPPGMGTASIPLRVPQSKPRQGADAYARIGGLPDRLSSP